MVGASWQTARSLRNSHFEQKISVHPASLYSQQGIRFHPKNDINFGLYAWKYGTDSRLVSATGHLFMLWTDAVIDRCKVSCVPQNDPSRWCRVSSGNVPYQTENHLQWLVCVFTFIKQSVFGTFYCWVNYVCRFCIEYITVYEIFHLISVCNCCHIY